MLHQFARYTQWMDLYQIWFRVSTFGCNSAKFCCNQFRGFDSVGGEFAISLLTVNTVLALQHSM